MDLFATAALQSQWRIAQDECLRLDALAPDPICSRYGHVKQVGRTRYVLLVHPATRYSVVLEAKGVHSTPILHARWKDALPRHADLAGLTAGLVSPLLTEAPVRIAKAVDRRVLGTINDWFRLLQGHHAASGPSLRALDTAELSRDLNDVPIIAGNFGFPRDRLVTFLGSIALHWSREQRRALDPATVAPTTAAPSG